MGVDMENVPSNQLSKQNKETNYTTSKRGLVYPQMVCGGLKMPFTNAP